MTYEQLTARCWAEIDLDMVRHNYITACEECPGVKVIPVLKADAYGLGAAEVAPVLHEAGADMFAVAEYGEAAEIKGVCSADVMVMGYTNPVLFDEALARDIILTIQDAEGAKALSAAAQRAGKLARIHIKIDTGLHRLGFAPETAAEETARIAALPNIRIEGIFTHLALRSRESDARQLAEFDAVTQALDGMGVAYGMRHALDSIGMLLYPHRRMDAVRAGAWIYGSSNRHFPHPEKCPLPMKLCARITRVAKVPAGECLGYDDENPLKRDSVIATVACGYYDGVPRVCSKGYVVINGQRAPIVGLVMMDQLTVDVTDVPGVKRGDAVTFLGDGISLLEASGWYSWNRNELMARMSRRVTKIYRGRCPRTPAKGV